MAKLLWLIKKRTTLSIVLCMLVFSISMPILMNIKATPRELFGGEDVVVLTNIERSALNTTLASQLAKQDFVDSVSPEIYAFCVLRGEPLLVRGVELENFLKIENAKIIEGEYKKDFALAGARVAERLRLGVGEDLTLTGSSTPAILETTISGVFLADSPADDELLLPLSEARRLVGLSGLSVSAIRVKTTNRALLTNFLEEEQIGVAVSDLEGGTVKVNENETYSKVEQELALKYSTTTRFSATNGTYVSTFIQKSAGSVSLVIYAFILLTASLSFIGISAILARAVIDRRRELGILSAIGARKMRVRFLLLKELLLISLPAAVIGALAGLICAKILQTYNILVIFGHTIQPVVSSSLAFITFFGCLIISCSSGLFASELVLSTTPIQAISELEEPKREKVALTLIDTLGM